jgi:L-ascorbate metabolism protein UlaG (beta-lactamase superfamily)
MLDRFVWYRQSSYRWRGDDRVVYIDPWGITDPQPADAIFITHAHFDHFCMEDIEKVRRDDTKIVAPRDVADELTGDVTAVRPGDSVEAVGIRADVVPAYNTAESRLEFHPRANGWVGYVLRLQDHTYYHAGDTDHLPELEQLSADVTFVPIGGTYTMDPVEAAGLVKVIAPQLAVPMHYGFVVGSPGDAERFAAEATPVRVETLKPDNPFER